MGKVILLVSDISKSLASMRITCLVRSSGQRNSSTLMISTSPM